MTIILQEMIIKMIGNVQTSSPVAAGLSFGSANRWTSNFGTICLCLNPSLILRTSDINWTLSVIANGGN